MEYRFAYILILQKRLPIYFNTHANYTLIYLKLKAFKVKLMKLP